MAVLTPASVFRYYETDGVPDSGKHKPKKSEIIQLLEQMQTAVAAGQIVRETKAELDLVTPPNEYYGGQVLNDPDATKNGYYFRDSAAWVKGRGFPDTAAVLTSVGGTGNAITASTSGGVNPADVVLAILPAAPGTNAAGAVTLSVNGQALPVKAASGAALAPGDIVEGVATVFFRIGSEWRQIFSSAEAPAIDHQGDWASGATYTEGQIVTGSNGNWYMLMAPSSIGDDPVGSVTGNWLMVLPAGSVGDGTVTFVKLNASAIASQADAENLASPPSYKLMTPQRSLQQGTKLVDWVDIRTLGAVAAAYASAVDCTSIIQAYITANPGGVRLRIPRTASGIGFKISHLELPANSIIEGAGSEHSNIWHFGNQSLFDVKGSYTIIRNLRVDGANATSPATTVKLRTDLSGLERIQIENISTYYSPQFFADGWSYLGAANLAVAVELENIKCRYHRGPGIDMRDCWAYTRLRNCVIDYIGSSSKNFAAYSMMNNAGSVWENCDTTGGTVDGTLANNHAFVFQKCTAVWMSNCFADTVDGHGFYMLGQCTGFYLVNCASSLVGNFPVAIGATGGASSNISLVNFHSYGRKGLTYAPASKPGIYAVGCSEIKVTGGAALTNTGDGILWENCNHCMTANFESRGNTGRGARTIGTGGAVLFTGGDYSDNTAGVFQFTGAAHHGVNVITTSGALGNLSGIGTL